MAVSYTCSSSSLTYPSFCSIISPQNPPSLSLLFPLFLLLSFSLISISLLIFSLYKRLSKSADEDEHDPQSQTSISTLKHSLSKISEKTQNTHQLDSPQSILLKVLPLNSNSNSPNWGAYSGLEDDAEIKGKKKKKKRKRGKKKELESCYSNGVNLELEKKEDLVCFYPFTSSSSATQRKIKQHYDQLVKSHDSNGLTLTQVGQFVNCLVDARNELQNKSEYIKRKFKITKALLQKADRSSFDRLRKQIYKLELEQKRLEEDAFVYNWLQHQLKLSPAYKKVVEIGVCMESKAKSGELTENRDIEQNNISFEEFLAQEKKDTFWQNYAKSKSCSG